MIKQMIEYVDIDDQRVSRTVMFNLTQYEMEGEMELEVLQERFQKFQDEVVGDDPNAPVREMTGPEKREMLSLVKSIIRHAYGVKDGKRFKKSQDLWDDFEQTGAFSAFVYHLFEKPERANAFMMGIWPQGLDRPEDIPSADLSVVRDDDAHTDTVPGEVLSSATDDPDEWHYMNYTREQLLAMSDESYEKVQKASIEGRNVPLPLIQIDGVRHSRKRGGSTDE